MAKLHTDLEEDVLPYDTLNDLKAYLQSEDVLRRNRMFTFPEFEVYLRIRHRVIEGRSVLCCDLGRILVNAVFRRRGIYDNLLKFLEQNSNTEVLFIENVHDGLHWNLYIRRGFTKYYSTGDSMTVHFYKWLKPKENAS